jgi:hypothetical protein
LFTTKRKDKGLAKSYLGQRHNRTKEGGVDMQLLMKNKHKGLGKVIPEERETPAQQREFFCS